MALMESIDTNQLLIKPFGKIRRNINNRDIGRKDVYETLLLLCVVCMWAVLSCCGRPGLIANLILKDPEDRSVGKCRLEHYFLLL